MKAEDSICDSDNVMMEFGFLKGGQSANVDNSSGF